MTSTAGLLQVKGIATRTARRGVPHGSGLGVVRWWPDPEK
jgi:hypothetical protein